MRYILWNACMTNTHLPCALLCQASKTESYYVGGEHTAPHQCDCPSVLRILN